MVFGIFTGCPRKQWPGHLQVGKRKITNSSNLKTSQLLHFTLHYIWFFICNRDKERKRRYRILVQSHLSQISPKLTKIVTLLPNFIVTNSCRKHLRFMEDNERADLWIDIAPGQVGSCSSYYNISLVKRTYT